MGAGQSTESEIRGSSMGYQVLRVYPDSPGSAANLEAYFDFIVAAGNTRFNKLDGSLKEILNASIDQKLKLTVYSTRYKRIREVEIVPSANWGGNGLLGVSIRFASFEGVDERVWHVISVTPNSPAFNAGLKANEDYVIGADTLLQDSDDLYNLIEAFEGRQLKLFVYNTLTDTCREVECVPNKRWGGEGSLGCEFGHGYLHRIPTKLDLTQGDNVSLLTPLLAQEVSQPLDPQQYYQHPSDRHRYAPHQQQQILQTPQLNQQQLGSQTHLQQQTHLHQQAHLQQSQQQQPQMHQHQQQYQQQQVHQQQFQPHTDSQHQPQLQQQQQFQQSITDQQPITQQQPIQHISSQNYSPPQPYLHYASQQMLPPLNPTPYEPQQPQTQMYQAQQQPVNFEWLSQQEKSN